MPLCGLRIFALGLGRQSRSETAVQQELRRVKVPTPRGGQALPSREPPSLGPHEQLICLYHTPRNAVQGQLDYEAQFESLAKILEQLSRHEINKDRVEFSEQVIGSGAYGDVRKATLRNRNSEIFAVKILRCHGSKAERARVAVRLAREIYIMARLSHPNIIPFEGFYLDRTELRTAWVIAPYMSHGNIGEYLKDHSTSIDVQKKLELALETGQGLSYLHSRDPPICHADIKPVGVSNLEAISLIMRLTSHEENILVTDDLHVLICDFGISRIISESNRFTTTNSAKGSTGYMSPELFTTDPRSTLNSDVWAWGCLVLQITSGTHPYSGLPSQGSIIGHISQGIKPAPIRLILTEIPYLLYLLHACWHFEPHQRLVINEGVSILSGIVNLGSERDYLPALPVLEGLHRYRINRDWVVEKSPGVLDQGGSSTISFGRITSKARVSRSMPADLVIKKILLRPGHLTETSMTFAREVGLLSELSHPNIIKMMGFVEDLQHGVAWILMPKARNGNLATFLASAGWGLNHRISLLWDTTTGVEYLHTLRPPIIHGDLKSVNVVVNEAGHAEIIDFGSSRMIESPDIAETFTLRWASPELLNGEPSSLASDIWALGWIFWE
ncbi:hypothetical protein FRC01_004115, partial [Tulasnella sp. 417]